MNKYLAASLIIVSFILGIGFGNYFSPEYYNIKTMPSHDGLGKADKFLDLRFINGMISHHHSAIYMLEQVTKKSKRAELHELAKVVIALDTQGIKDLYELKARLYLDNRQVRSFERINIGDADDLFDLRFLNAMIIHHVQAITVSQELLSKSSNTKTIQIASDVIKLLSDNLQTLKAWRKEWYGIDG